MTGRGPYGGAGAEEERARPMAPLRRSVAAWGIGCFLLAAATGSYLDSLHVAERRQAFARADAAAAIAEQSVLRAVEAVRSVHSLLDVWQALSDAGDGTAARAVETELMRLAQGRRTGVVQVSIVGPDGRVTWGTAPGAVGVSLADREHVRAHLDGDWTGGLFVSAPVVGRTTGRWSIQVSRVLPHADGSFAGIAVVSLDPLVLARSLGDGGQDDGRAVAIRRLSDGAILAHSRDPEGQLARPAEPAHPVVEAARRTPAGLLAHAEGPEGRDVLVAYRVPDGLPLAVTAVHEMASEMSGFVRALRISLAAVVVAALGGLGAAIGWGRSAAARQEVEAGRHRLAESEARYRLLAENARDVVTSDGMDGDFRYVSGACARVLGWHPEELVGRSARDYVHPDDRVWLDAALTAMRDGDREASASYRMRRSDGDWVWVEVHYRVHLDPLSGRPAGYVSTIRDATERKRAEKELLDAYDRMEEMASTDALTGLANRRRFAAALEGEWRRCARDGLPLSLLIVDVDHFKRFNDRYGHPAGDACLREVGATLGAVARRPADLAARTGGEEFALLMPGTDMHGARHVAERLREAMLARALAHAGNPAGGIVTLSIGVATVQPTPGSGEQERECLLSAADAALYAAKEGGRDRIEAAPPRLLAGGAMAVRG